MQGRPFFVKLKPKPENLSVFRPVCIPKRFIRSKVQVLSKTERENSPDSLIKSQVRFLFKTEIAILVGSEAICMQVFVMQAFILPFDFEPRINTP